MNEYQIKVGDKIECANHYGWIYDDYEDAEGPECGEVVTISRIGCIVDEFEDFCPIFWLEEYPGTHEIDHENAFYASEFKLVS
jgi:hypothetical protein